MKPMSTALLFSLLLTGAACSDPAKGAAAAEAPPPAEPMEVEMTNATSGSEIGGTLNLNIGGASQSESTRLLGSGGLSGSGESSRLIGSGTLGGGNFGEGPDLGIELLLEEDTEEPVAARADPPEDDDLIRLPD